MIDHTVNPSTQEITDDKTITFASGDGVNAFEINNEGDQDVLMKFDSETVGRTILAGKNFSISTHKWGEFRCDLVITFSGAGTKKAELVKKVDTAITV